MTTGDETWEVRPNNAPAITNYRHRCREIQQNENLQAYSFKHVNSNKYSLKEPLE